MLLELCQAVSNFSLKRLLLGGSQEMRSSHHAGSYDIMRTRGENGAIKYSQVIVALVCIVYVRVDLDRSATICASVTLPSMLVT